MRPNIPGTVGGLITFISLALPWWTMALTFSYMGITQPAYMSLYLYQAKTSAIGWSARSHLDLSFGYVTLALVILGGLLGTVGGLIRHDKMILIGGVLAIASMTVFAAGLQSELWNAPINPWGYLVPGLFSSGSIDQGLSSVSYTTYLSFGFWITLVAAIAMLAASLARVARSSPRQPPPS